MEHIKKIMDLKLIKVDNSYNRNYRKKYYYNLYLDGIDEPLLLDPLSSPIPKEIIGREIKFNLNEENLIDYLEII